MHGTTANRRTKGRVICPSPSRLISCIAVVFLLAMAVPASAGPVSGFTSNITTGSAPLTVQFTDTSTGSPAGWAWYFGDEKYDASWTLVNASPGWQARRYHSSVVMPDGSIILTGGNTNLGTPAIYVNDVWRSTDNGATWTQMTAGAAWEARAGHTTVAMPDGSIILMGGGGIDTYGDPITLNDVWRSTDSGKTWTMRLLAGELSKRGRRCLLLDFHGDLVLPGIQSYPISLDSRYGVNPLEINLDPDGGGPAPRR